MKCVAVANTMLASILALPVLAQPAAASSDGYETPNWRIQLDAGKTHYSAREVGTTGQLLNRESGLLLTETVTGTYVQDQWSWQISWEHLHDTVPYDGVTQTGVPITTQSRILANRYSALTHCAWITQPDWSLAPLLGLEQFQLDRTIAATPPSPPSLPLGTQALQEVLTTRRAILGLSAKWMPPKQAWTLTAGVQMMPSWHQSLKVNTYGTYDEKSLRPGHSTDWRLNLSAAYPWSPQTLLTANWTRESFKPGASGTEALTKNGIPSASIQYPGSQQFLSGIKFGVLFLF